MSGQGTSGEERADHSKFVEHLRLVHFTLCLTCFVAIIAVAAKSSSSAQRAYQQANLLLKLEDKWQYSRWLDPFVYPKIVQQPGFEASIEEPGSDSQVLTFRPGLPFVSPAEAYPWLVFAEKDRQTESMPSLGRFTDIDASKSAWNMLNEVQYFAFPEKVHDGWEIKFTGGTTYKIVDAKLNGGIPVTVTTTKWSEGKNYALARLCLQSKVDWIMSFLDIANMGGSRLRDAAREITKGHKSSCYLIASENRSRYFMFPVDCRFENFDPLRLLRDSMLPEEIPIGDFARAFPDAYELGKGLKSLSLSELRDYFQTEQDRAGDKVELPLVKLPAASTAYWGSAIVFLLAAYWFAVFRDFELRARPNDMAWDTPWVGISKEPWSQRLFLATAFLVPATVAYLIFNGLDRSFVWELRSLFAIGAFIVVGIPVAGIVSSWRRLTN